MQLKKISCLQCPQRDTCSQKTRIFVNYCGSKIGTVEKNIKEAIAECRSKGGLLAFKSISPIPCNQTRQLGLDAAA